MPDKIDIAFRRKVRAVWLDKGLDLAAQNVSWEDAKPILAEMITVENPGVETTRKVLEHVRRIWFSPAKTSPPLHADALALYRADSTATTRFVLNWGMSITAYPFVGAVAEALGRLIKLQGEAKKLDVQRRMREQFGDRDTINRLTRYNISSFLDWEAIKESKDGGVYQPGKQVCPQDSKQIAWLIEAAIISCRTTQMLLSSCKNHPTLFPFSSEAITPTVLNLGNRLQIVTNGFKGEYIQMRSG